MQKKLTLTIDEKVYEGLHKVIGQGKISRFIEDLVRPHVIKKELFSAYEKMSLDVSREAEALDWVESTSRDISEER